MDQHRAVGKKMASIKVEDVIPAKYYWYMRECLMEMYVVGWEQGRFEINQHANKPIAQINSDGKVINMFKSQIDAAKRTHVSIKGIYKSMVNNKPIKGFRWKYIEPIEIEVFNRDNGMY
jgi:hypothetical protein